jgi:hypothetical protein
MAGQPVYLLIFLTPRPKLELQTLTVYTIDVKAGGETAVV